MRDISDRSIDIKAGNKWRGLTFRACTFCIGGGAYLEKTQKHFLFYFATQSKVHMLFIFFLVFMFIQKKNCRSFHMLFLLMF